MIIAFLKRLFVGNKSKCVRCKADTNKNGWYLGHNRTLCVPCGPKYLAEKQKGIRHY